MGTGPAGASAEWVLGKAMALVVREGE